MHRLVKSLLNVSLLVLISLSERLSSLTTVFAGLIGDCKEGKIISGENDGVTCNTYYQCFEDDRTPNTWIIKTFNCPPGGIWDREYLACVEGTSCSGGGGGVTSGPFTPSPSPTYGPSPFTTTTVPPEACPTQSGRECLDSPSPIVSSYWSRNKTRSLLSFPFFHEYTASTPNSTLEDGSTILQNAMAVTPTKGKWHKSEHCPSRSYAIGIDYHDFQNGADYAGIHYLSFLCQTPGGKENKLVETIATGSFIPSASRKFSDICTGAIVGFQLRVRPAKGKESASVDQINAICSTHAPKRKLALGMGRSLNIEDNWATPQICGRFQAMCGFRAQLHNFQVNQDNTGLNTLQIQCCPVPHPLKDCVPTEERLHIRTCDNAGSSLGLRCDFESKIGLGLDYDWESGENEIIFYSSIGYDFLSIREEIKDKIISKLASSSPSSKYSWNNVHCQVDHPEISSWKTVCLKPNEKVELYQIVGKCGYFLVRTNRFVKVMNDASEGSKPEEYFDL